MTLFTNKSSSVKINSAKLDVELSVREAVTRILADGCAILIGTKVPKGKGRKKRNGKIATVALACDAQLKVE